MFGRLQFLESVARYEKIFIDKLNEKYLKIKECLSRCGNKVEEIDKKEEVEKILYSFLNTRKEIIDLL